MPALALANTPFGAALWTNQLAMLLPSPAMGLLTVIVAGRRPGSTRNSLASWAPSNSLAVPCRTKSIPTTYDQIGPGVEKRGHKPVPTAELVVRSQRGEGATPKGALQLRPLSCALWHRCPAGPAE